MDEFVLLRDGGQLRVRRYRPEDREQIRDLLLRLSPESRTLRFHVGGAKVNERVIDAATTGHALVGEIAGRIVALASYVPLRRPGYAEMSIVVDDREHGRGIGTALFELLARDARREGIRSFLALVLASNISMLGMLQSLGFRIARRYDGGEVEVEVDLKPDAAYLERADERMHVAATASLTPLFRPRAVALVGASRQPGSIGGALFRNALAGGFSGPVFPVNPAATAVASVRAYPSVGALPDPVDLAVIAVPASAVLTVAKECLDVGVRALVVISAGFAEVGEEGRARQQELVDMCRRRGARLVGPNCLGVLVSSAGGVLNLTFAPTQPPRGPVAVASQSGALGIAILEEASRLGIGLSHFVSMGNKADVSSNDLIEWWEDDPATGLIVLYLESFGNPRRFARIARRVGRRKPIAVIKAGRSETGRRAAASHTAALAGSDIAADALFRQAGVIRCDTLDDLLGVTSLLANQPLPGGNRVGIVTNAGGLGILCADACEAAGLEVPPLSPETQAALRARLPAEAAVGNPVDIVASTGATGYADALRLVLDDPLIDAAIVLFVPPLVTRARDVERAVASVVTASNTKPVLASYVGIRGRADPEPEGPIVPRFAFPEAAARALGKVVGYANWLRRPAGAIPEFHDLDVATARRTIEQALAEHGTGWLDPIETATILTSFGIAIPAWAVAHTAEETAAAFRQFNRPVAVKLLSRSIIHKTDVGGVRLGIQSAEDAAAAFEAIRAELVARGQEHAMEGVVVQPMETGGVECLVGVVSDPVFGPLIGFGLGGVTAELMGDVQFQLHPLTDVDADELIARSKAAKLLAGYRGAPPADTAALTDLLLRVSRLVEELPEVVELDLNPVLVRERGLVALDSRLRVAPAVSPPLR
ncbi:MAG: GNAT family N-acetyltransferase [Dehalococcoidia bacterium]|nr:MAG: GNAT family N-acetyltransferase [Dehalococcoidia bacterium]